MRSVVVVLPASMCAMIPMLRTLARSTAVTVATFPRSRKVLVLVSLGSGLRLPAVVGEGLVGLRHLVGVLAPLDAGAEAVARVEQLVHEPLGHRLLAAVPGVGDDPAQRERGAARRADLDRHLVGGAADPAAADLERRLDVVQRALQGDHRVVARLLPAALERPVHDVLGDLDLASQPDPGDLAQGRVRLLRRGRVDTRAHAAALRALLERRRLVLRYLVLAALADQLLDRGQPRLRLSSRSGPRSRASPVTFIAGELRVSSPAQALRGDLTSRSAWGFLPSADPRGRACRPDRKSASR